MRGDWYLLRRSSLNVCDEGQELLLSADVQQLPTRTFHVGHQERSGLAGLKDSVVEWVGGAVDEEEPVVAKGSSVGQQQTQVVHVTNTVKCHQIPRAVELLHRERHGHLAHTRGLPLAVGAADPLQQRPLHHIDQPCGPPRPQPLSQTPVARQNHPEGKWQADLAHAVALRPCQLAFILPQPAFPLGKVDPVVVDGFREAGHELLALDDQPPTCVSVVGLALEAHEVPDEAALLVEVLGHDYRRAQRLAVRHFAGVIDAEAAEVRAAVLDGRVGWQPIQRP
mmetsp:Transcript_38393/g.96172  ORF Transcript_38393/g.96172 Transcript_38393/m.96172 type:complete len:281 (-) Transcript_38393:224-1066(-)